MSEFIQEAGWGFWPVLLFGGITLLLSVWHAIAPKPGQLAMILGFGVATFCAGMLGTIAGYQHSVEGVRQASERWLVALGLREALNNMVAALAAITLSALATTVGAYRLGRPKPKPVPAAILEA